MSEDKPSVSIGDVEGKTGIVIRTDKKPIVDETRKIRILWYSDFLRHTGFGNVSEAIITRLQATGRYQFEVLGINHNGDPYNYIDSEYRHLKNIPVWPAADYSKGDLFGFEKLVKLIGKRPFDLLFCLQDTFNLIKIKPVIEQARKIRDFRYIFYFPVDGDLHKSWVTDAVQVADFPVVYTEFGKKKVQEISPGLPIKVINHGVDLNTFKPMNTEGERKEFRESYFGANSEDFIITNVNRNQPRKDIPRTILAFFEFCKRYPEVKAKLYLHCLVNDSAGFNLGEICRLYQGEESLDKVIIPKADSFGGNGYPVEMIRKIYCASDVITSTTLGEGWGLSTTEAMACKTPVVMPNNTATTEIIGENEERGYLVKSGADVNHHSILKYDNGLRRPLTDINDLVDKWYQVFKDKEGANKKTEVAYEWLQNKTWDAIAKQWDELFQEAYLTLKKA